MASAKKNDSKAKAGHHVKSQANNDTNHDASESKNLPKDRLVKTRRISKTRESENKNTGVKTKRLYKITAPSGEPSEQTVARGSKTKEPKPENTTPTLHKNKNGKPEEPVITNTSSTVANTSSNVALEESNTDLQLPPLQLEGFDQEEQMAMALGCDLPESMIHYLQQSPQNFKIFLEFMKERASRHPLLENDWAYRQVIKNQDILLLLEQTIDVLQELKTAIQDKTEPFQYLSMDDFFKVASKKISVAALWDRPSQAADSSVRAVWLLPSPVKSTTETSLTFLLGACLGMSIDPSLPYQVENCWNWQVSPSRALLCNPHIPFGLIRTCQIATHTQECYRFHSLDAMIARLQNVIQNYQRAFLLQPRKEQGTEESRQSPNSIPENNEVYTWSTAGYVVGKYPRVATAQFSDAETFRNRCQDRIFWYHSKDYQFSLLMVGDGVTNTFLGSGDRAAEILVQTAQEKISIFLQDKNNIGDDQSIERTMALMQDICYSATDKIVAEVLSNYNPTPREAALVMGSTAAMVAIVQNQAIVMSLGDSRVYLVRPGETVEQCTVDCTPHVLAHCYPEYQSIYHDNQTLALCVGHAKPTKNSIEPWHDPCHFRIIPVQPHDHLILCSDGLFDALDPIKLPEDIFEEVWGANVIQENTTISVAYQAFQLLSMAMRTGEDDVSIIISRCLPNKEARTVKMTKD